MTVNKPLLTFTVTELVGSPTVVLFPSLRQKKTDPFPFTNANLKCPAPSKGVLLLLTLPW
jgi:hypothetical protein